MQGALYAGTVIIAELADVGNYVVQVRRGNLFGIQDEVAVGESGLRRARQVQDNLQELAEVEHVSERAHDPGRQAMEEEVRSSCTCRSSCCVCCSISDVSPTGKASAG